MIAALIIVIVIYYLFVVRNISDEDLRNQSILDAIQEKVFQRKQFYSQLEIRQLYDFREELRLAKTIDLIGYSFVGLLSNFQKEIEQALLNGTRIRLLIIGFKSKASKLMERYMDIKEMQSDQERIKQRIDQIQLSVSKVDKEARNRFEVRYMDWIPSSSLIMTNRDLNSGKVKLKIYALDLRTEHSNILTHSIVSKTEDPELFEYFKQQFEKIWTDANG